MDRRRYPAAVGILLLAAAYALPLPDMPLGGDATQLLAAASLWHDRDLRFEPRDLERGYATWLGGPRGIALAPGRASGEYVFAAPLPFTAMAAPVLGLCGPRGVRVLNMALFLAMFWIVRRRLVAGPVAARSVVGRAPPRPLPRQVGLLVGAFFLASGAFAWTLRFGAEVFLMASTFLAVATWCGVRCEPVWGRRERRPMAASGALLAAAAVSEPALALIGLPILIDLAWSRRWKSAAAFAGTFVAVALVLGSAQGRLTGAWGPDLTADAQVFHGPYPFEAGAVAAPGAGDAGPERSPALLLRRAAWLLAGRHVGLVPYFPFALFAVALFVADLRGRGGRARNLLAAALLAYLVLAVVRFPWAAALDGAAAAPGLRATALVYPLFLLLPRRLRAGRTVALPALAAGLWLVPALAVAGSGVSAVHAVELPARGPTYRPLPLELELLAAGQLPGYGTFDRFPAAMGGHWLVPRETFYLSERHPEGIWVRGATRSEIYVVSAGPLEAVRFRASSIAAANVLEVRGEGDTLRARFDSPGKRRGVPVEVRPELMARGLGLFSAGEPDTEHVYRFVLETSAGAVPARVDPSSADGRYLGVFLTFTDPDS